MKMEVFRPEKRCLLPSDPFFFEGDMICQRHLNKQARIFIDGDEFFHTGMKEFPCKERGCKASFDDIQDFESHYNSFHRHVCTECRRKFPSDHLLSIHIQENHDSYFQTQLERGTEALYQCLVEGCKRTFADIQSRRTHQVNDHKYPYNYRFDEARCTKKTENSMDIDGKENTVKKVVNKVPNNICFGYGSMRAFEWGSASKAKPKHIKQKQSKTRTNIEDVTMTELKDALEEAALKK